MLSFCHYCDSVRWAGPMLSPLGRPRSQQQPVTGPTYSSAPIPTPNPGPLPPDPWLSHEPARELVRCREPGALAGSRALGRGSKLPPTHTPVVRPIHAIAGSRIRPPPPPQSLRHPCNFPRGLGPQDRAGVAARSRICGRWGRQKGKQGPLSPSKC